MENFDAYLPSGPKLGTKGDARRRAAASCDASDIHSSTPGTVARYHEAAASGY